ncbi:MAG: outer membrane beta-barrel protein [Gammaproteobacteria bacterium]|nr:outer membrane beta-barrel protein [Gammaproteobacteria bacterium]
MGRFNRVSFRLGVLYCLVVCSMPANSEDLLENRAYFSLGLAAVFPEETRFTDNDRADSGLPKLYGSPDIFTDGDFDTGIEWRAGMGYRFTPALRAQVEFGMANGLDYRGNANYHRSGARQPSEAELDTRQFLFAGFYDFPSWEATSSLRIQPYLGAGAGITDYDLEDFVQRFPAPDNPHGYLRRGAKGEIPLTRLPAGSGQEFTWMVTAGVVIPMTKRTRLDLSYRYTDAGEITTGVGDITIERYRSDGRRREDLLVEIDKTVAELKTHALLAAFRFEF